MSPGDTAAFYSSVDEALQQGDILLGAVARVVGDDAFSPPRWRPLDEYTADLAAAVGAGAAMVPALRVAAGRALVMAVTHDCGMDKEFNAVLDRSGDSQLTGDALADAVRRVEERHDLDRSFTVSPLVAPESVTVAGEPVDQGLLMGGRIVGYLPVPELVVAGVVVIPTSVVDLSYRTTLDRIAYTTRLTCVSERAREQLRFALAKLDVLRTPALEGQLENAVGQAISKATVSKKNPLIVQLTLADGTVMELLKKPGSPSAQGAARGRRSVRGPG